MAIYTPGLRDRHNKATSKGGRNMVAILSLTAMVDMFTVLVVFLLQNYKIDAIKLQNSIDMPQAAIVKKLAPAHVVSVSKTEIFIDSVSVATLQEVKDSEPWLIVKVQTGVQEAIKKSRDELSSGFRNKLKQSVADPAVLEDDQKRVDMDAARVTVQADKSIDFLTIKKILHSVTEAGAYEINFAVVEESKPKE